MEWRPMSNERYSMIDRVPLLTLTTNGRTEIAPTLVVLWFTSHFTQKKGAKIITV